MFGTLCQSLEDISNGVWSASSAQQDSESLHRKEQ